MRSTKAFFLGVGTAVLIDRARVRRRRRAAGHAAVPDEIIELHVRADALPAAGVSSDEVALRVEDGVVTVEGSVAGSDTADALIQHVAEVPGVRNVAAMIRVSERHAA
jgi:osmotically-inducible protein OsmY